MGDIICEGPITKQHIETILQEHFNTQAKIATAKGEVISKGLGFTSDVMRVDLVWEVDEGLPTRVIAKAPKIENIAVLMEKFSGDNNQEAMANSAKFVPIIHATECTAYGILTQEKPIPLPKIYGLWPVGEKNPGLIVMEDLGERACIIDNLATGLNMNQWRSIVEGLADLHAWSLTTEIPWREQVSDFHSMEDFFKSFSQMAGFGLKQIKEKYPEYFAHLQEDLILNELDFDKLVEQYTEFLKIMPEVLQHGDTWINNIMFERKPDGTISDKVAAFIDWQICIKGSPVNDLARLENWCVNHKLRREKGEEMLHYYYDRLKSKAGDKLPATYEQIKTLHDSATAMNGLFGCMMVDFLLEHVAKVDEDESGFRKKELLERVRAGLDDAGKHFGWTPAIPVKC